MHGFDKFKFLLENYVTEVEQILPFLEHISKVRCTQHRGTNKVQWEVRKQICAQDDACSTGVAQVSITVCAGSKQSKSRWLVINDRGIVDNNRGGNIANVDGPAAVRCMLAARVPYAQQDTKALQGGSIRNNNLFPSFISFPLHFYLPDEAFLASSCWKRAIPEDARILRKFTAVYMQLLTNLSAHVGQLAYCFWPMPGCGHTLFDGALAAEFWLQLPQSRDNLLLSGSDSAITFPECVFDFTPRATSWALQQLFKQMEVKNIVRPPQQVATSLLKAGYQNMSVVDSRFVRELLKTPSGERALLEIWSTGNFSCQPLNVILGFVLDFGKDRRELLISACLPLMDGKLGMLCFHGSDKCSHPPDPSKSSDSQVYPRVPTLCYLILMRYKGSLVFHLQCQVPPAVSKSAAPYSTPRT
jgi:hypothetical protein